MNLRLTSALLALSVVQRAHCSDWPMFAGNPQRTGVVAHDDELKQETAGKLKLQWKLKLDNKTKELTALTVPVSVSGIPAPGGFRDFVVIAGSDDNLFVLDGDNGKLVWQKHFQNPEAPKQEPHWLCPNALTATPLIDRNRLLVYALSTDGKLHSLNLVNGEDAQPPRQMTPPYAKTWSLNMFHDTIYTATSQGCGAVRSAIYAMGAGGGEAKQFLAMKTFGAGIWGRAGVAVGQDGTVYAETGDGSFDPQKGQYPDTVLAVDGKSLELKDYYTPKNNKWIWKKDLDMGNMSPVVFPYKGKELVAASGKEGVIYLLDTKNMGGTDHMTPLYRSELLANANADFAGHGFWGAMSAWTDSSGDQWLFAPAYGPATDATKFQTTYGDAQQGSVMAFKVTGPADKPALTPIWRSVNMSVPEPVAVANDVVFALSNGENVGQVDEAGHIYKSDYRIQHPSRHGILYALDAHTGKVLFSSGDTIPGFSHFTGVAVADSRVYVVTHDNTVYAFGLAE
jgi:outer membrane protein assembly factor BamB